MSRTKKEININSIIKNNPKVNESDLARNLKMINELQKNGVNFGPDYNLSSPYSRPYSRSNRTPKKNKKY